MIICVKRSEVSKSYSYCNISSIIKRLDWFNFVILFIWYCWRIFSNSFDNCLARLSKREARLDVRFDVTMIFANDNEKSFEMTFADNSVSLWMTSFWINFLLRLRFLFSCVRSFFRNRFFLNSWFFSRDLVMIAFYDEKKMREMNTIINAEKIERNFSKISTCHQFEIDVRKMKCRKKEKCFYKNDRLF
jgi:hypothetical protein